MTLLEKNLLFAGILLYLVLFIFSYFYVDLNLTLTTNELALKIISFLQGFGYFQRSLSTLIFIFILTALFTLFVTNIYLFSKKKLSKKYLIILITVITLISIFSYPFLSYDVFNYMFDAKIILVHHVSPYTHKALDFPQDDWTRFMRWTHRYSPYGPTWLLISTLPALLSFGKFVLNLFAFKALMAVFHLLNTYLIFKILKNINSKNSLLGAAFYGINPLFLIEGVVNAHNDVLITTSLLLSLLFLILNKRLLSLLGIVLSASIKYFPIIVIPWLILKFFRKEISLKTTAVLCIATLSLFSLIFSSIPISVPFIPAGSTQSQFQPWYLFWTIPLISILNSRFLFLASIIISASALLRYLPFLLYGEWGKSWSTLFMTMIIILPISAFSIAYFLKIKWLKN